MKDFSYEKLFETIQPTLPSNWYKFTIHASFPNSTIVVRYDVETNNHECISCFDLNCDAEQLLQVISDIHCEIIRVRDQLAEQQRWNGVVITIENSGSFRTNFSYDSTAWTKK